MVFLRKHEWNKIQRELDYLRNWKAVTQETEAATDAHVSGLEQELGSLWGWLNFLQLRLEDYDGLILEYMAQEAEKNEDR